MKESLRKINELLVDVYNDILNIEIRSLRGGQFHDVSIKEVHTLEAVGLHQEPSMGEVARRLDITVGTLTVAVNNLVKKGYIERIRSDEDRRVVNIRLTNKGRVLYRLHEKFHVDMVESCIDTLTDEETEVLGNALEKVNVFFKTRYGAGEGDGA